MSYACEICGKGVVYGKKGIHKHSVQWKKRAPFSLTTWKPNLRRVKINIDGQVKRIRICTECLKSTKIIANEPVNLVAPKTETSETPAPETPTTPEN